ncbi:MAG: hypothetical protein Tsb0020_16600 [Haliangiales bacterium]
MQDKFYQYVPYDNPVKASAYPRARRELTIYSRTWRVAMFIGVFASMWAKAPPASAEPPPAVSIRPNAIQALDQPMTISLHGSAGQTLHILVLRSCDADPNTPEVVPSAAFPRCNPRVWTRTVALDPIGDGRAQVTLPMSALPAEVHGRKLWVRVASDASGQGAYSDAVFAVLDTPCSLFDTILGWFSDGACSTDVVPTLRAQMSAPEHSDAGLEVRRLVRRADDSWSPPEIVPGTRFATGAAWVDAKHILVTLDAAHGGLPTASDSNVAATPGGLYRIHVASGHRVALAEARRGELLMAPFALGPDSLVFVRSRVTPASDGTAATLVIQRKGSVVREWPLRTHIHRILAANAAQTQVLAYSRQQGVPELLSIDLQTGHVTSMGTADQLYLSALRAPGGQASVIALRDKAGYYGWDLVLVNKRGELSAELAVGRGDDLMPSWHPDGHEILYLGGPRHSHRAR